MSITTQQQLSMLCNKTVESGYLIKCHTAHQSTTIIFTENVSNIIWIKEVVTGLNIVR